MSSYILNGLHLTKDVEHVDDFAEDKNFESESIKFIESMKWPSLFLDEIRLFMKNNPILFERNRLDADDYDLRADANAATLLAIMLEIGFKKVLFNAFPGKDEKTGRQYSGLITSLALVKRFTHMMSEKSIECFESFLESYPHLEVLQYGHISQLVKAWHQAHPVDPIEEFMTSSTTPPPDKKDIQ